VPRTRAHRRSEARLLAEWETALRPGRRATIIGYGWWWRYELAILISLVAGTTLLIRGVGIMATVIGASAAIGAAVGWPPAHRACKAAAWRIITPHRLRVGFAQARIHSSNGRLPTIIQTTMQPFGERVRLWCPAGTSAEDIRSARELLRTACWAGDIRVTCDRRHVHLVTVDVIRSTACPLDEPVQGAGSEKRRPGRGRGQRRS
jgi:hypothetical protein